MKTSTMLERSRRELANPVPKGELADARDVVIDPSPPPEERVRSYIRQIGNPYRFRVGDVEVRVRFAGEATLDECLAHYAEHLDAAGSCYDALAARGVAVTSLEGEDPEKLRGVDALNQMLEDDVEDGSVAER